MAQNHAVPRAVKEDGHTFYDTQIYGDLAPDGADSNESSLMDNEVDRKDFKKCYEWWTQARLVQSENRYQMALDDDFYDGLQWSEEDKNILEERNQAPLVFNEIKPTIDWILGTQRRSRLQYKVHPRNDDDVEGARNKDHLLKYLDDVNWAQYARSRAFDDATRVGIGWLEDGIRNDPTEEPLFSRNESWRNMWYDHLGQDPSGKDWRYVFRAKWTDLDVALAYFPDHQHLLSRQARQHDLYGGTDDDEFFLSQLYYQTDSQGRPIGRRIYTEDPEFAVQNRRERVRLIEGWYRKPEKTKVIKTFDASYSRYDGAYEDLYQDDEQLADLIGTGYASVFDAIRMRVWLCIFVEAGPLLNRASPYRHDRFPFTPIFAYRRKRDGAPYGVIRNQRDPQEDLNKRRSKALHLMNTNQVFAEDGAFEDKEELREEIARPDGIIIYRAKKKFEVQRGAELAQGHFEMEKYDKVYIRSVSGVTEQNLGKDQHRLSGIAIQRLQNEGSIVTTELFDNMRLGVQVHGEKRLSLVEQFMSAEKVVRITGKQGMSEHVKVNEVGEDENGEVTVLNDITQRQADFVVDQADFRATVRQSMAETMFDLMGRLAQVDAMIALQLLDLAVDLLDIPNKEYVVARIRKLTGVVDPEEAQTPEGQEAEQQRQAQEQEQAEMQRRAADADIRLKEEQANKTATERVLNAMKAISEAMTAGGESAVAPELAPLADEIIRIADEMSNHAAQAA